MCQGKKGYIEDVWRMFKKLGSEDSLLSSIYLIDFSTQSSRQAAEITMGTQSIQVFSEALWVNAVYILIAASSPEYSSQVYRVEWVLLPESTLIA